jgi:hypothetical protein
MDECCYDTRDCLSWLYAHKRDAKDLHSYCELYLGQGAYRWKRG